MGASVKTLLTSCPIFSLLDYCRVLLITSHQFTSSAYPRLINSVLNVTGFLRPTPTEYLPVLLGIQPAKFCRLGVTLSITNCCCLGPDHNLHGQLQRSQNGSKERLKSRRLFVPAARKILDSISETGIGSAHWRNTKWNVEHNKGRSAIHTFIPRVSTRLLGMGFPRASLSQTQPPSFCRSTLLFVDA